MQDLPIGISEFTELRTRKCLYVDKTKYVYRLLTKETRSFLSRPRRFGKSLLLSTLEAALQGKKELFKDLWIEESGYSWAPHAVIRLDFSELSVESKKEFTEDLKSALLDIGIASGISLQGTAPLTTIFRSLILQLSAKTPGESVAILIDEYDYPILHTLHSPALAMEIRDVVKSFSTVVKARAKQVKFVFVTGVSAFSKSGLSSGLNNLTNLTMFNDFFDICGYTDEEVNYYFTPYIESWAKSSNIPYLELRENLKAWYNGYRFVKNTPTSYSPFSLISSLHTKELHNFWFESATPQFLLDEIAKVERQEECKFLTQDDFYGTLGLLQTFEIENMPLMALLFQMGYLTLDIYDESTKAYHLKYPNLEVKTALHKHLMIALTKISPSSFDSFIVRFITALKKEDMEEFIACLEIVFAKIPYCIQENEEKKKEKFYHSIIQALFVAADIRSHAEYCTALGRADIIIELPNIIYILELKVGGSSKVALEQIENRQYADPFWQDRKTVRAIGIAFAQPTKKKQKDPLSITYSTKRLSR